MHPNYGKHNKTQTQNIQLFFPGTYKKPVSIKTNPLLPNTGTVVAPIGIIPSVP